LIRRGAGMPPLEGAWAGAACPWNFAAGQVGLAGARGSRDSAVGTAVAGAPERTWAWSNASRGEFLGNSM
jgi:hypothetical protein